MSDPVSDMLTIMRNGAQRSKPSVELHSSKFKESIAKVLKEEGYIRDYRTNSVDSKRTMIIDLKYHNGAPAFNTLRRVSKPSLRVFKSKDELPKVQGGLGVAIISTSQGVISDKAARKLGQGGEIICTVD